VGETVAIIQIMVATDQPASAADSLPPLSHTAKAEADAESRDDTLRCVGAVAIQRSYIWHQIHRGQMDFRLSWCEFDQSESGARLVWGALLRCPLSFHRHS